MKNEMDEGFGEVSVLTRAMLVDPGANRAFRRLCDVLGGIAPARGAAPAEGRASGSGRRGREKSAA
jgi:hypothetical protein